MRRSTGDSGGRSLVRVPPSPRPTKTGVRVKITKESAQLNVLISGGFAGAYERLLPEFQRMSGIEVTTGSGASQGSGPQTIAAQLGRGVAADVVILSREGLNELMAAKRIALGTDVDLARVRLGVAVRAGTTKPDVSTVEGFKQALLNAKSVAIPGSTSEILHVVGVDFAGRIAPEIQFVQMFSAAVVAGSGEIEGSKRLIEFLGSGRASEAIRNSGMEPLGTAK